MAPDQCPRAMFGGLLWGDAAVRYVYVDEAGTSAEEPVSIVVGLVVHADTQIMFAEAAVREVLQPVPPEFQDGFVFHAKDLFGSRIYRERWSMAARLTMLKSMMELPRRLGIPIALGMVRRTAEPWAMPENLSLTPAQSHHLAAFVYCISEADRYIRNCAALNEVATVVAEDIPQNNLKAVLRIAPHILRTPQVVPPGMLIPTQEEREAGFMRQTGEFRVSRIRHSVHFVDKTDDPLLQLADACAFGFRRFFSDQAMGGDFVSAILGQPPNVADFAGPASAVMFFGHPRKPGF